MADTDLKPCAKARNELFHFRESRDGSGMGRITRTNVADVKHTLFQSCHAVKGLNLLRERPLVLLDKPLLTLASLCQIDLLQRPRPADGPR